MSHNIINWICSNWNKLHVTKFRLKLVITCSFYASLLMYWLSFTWWIIFYVDVSGYGKPAWVWVWAKFYTRHGYEFFSGRIFSSRVRVWASNTQRVFTSCHLYSCSNNGLAQRNRLRSPFQKCAQKLWLNKLRTVVLSTVYILYLIS
jgi:hypothetical protein